MRALIIPAALLMACIAVGTIVVSSTVESQSPGPANLPAAVTDAAWRDGGRPDSARTALGRVLFFDKELSGNRNIACATCHHPTLGTTDGVALGFGEGPEGLGPDRRPGAAVESGVHERVPRNSPALFNLGAREFTVLFHDGRVSVDTGGYYASGFVTPAKWKLPEGLESVLAAQAMFPVTSPTEMAGQKGENGIADARSLNNVAGPGGVWEQLAQRLQRIPAYVARFRAAYPGRIQRAEDITFVHAANAIAAFEAAAFRSDGSPYDAYVRGNRSALTPRQRSGMALFYGEAGCSDCHAGPFQTDHRFYAIAMPQVGPGKGDGGDASYWRHSGERAFVEDHGLARVTGRPGDAFRFRTPSLRNVALTAPYGHSGAYRTLEDVVRHHLDPVRSLERYDPARARLTAPSGVLEITVAGSRLRQEWLTERRLLAWLERDGWVQRSPVLRDAIARANQLAPRRLSDAQVGDLVAFLEALTDPAMRDLLHVVPERVPSGLPVD